MICGYGNIGKHIHNEFSSLNDNIVIYDKYKTCESTCNISDYVNYTFICLPTDMLEDGSCDISEVENAISQINSDLIIIKSTIPTGTTEYLKTKYKKDIIFSPEYYGTTIHAPKSPDFLILGGNKSSIKKAAELYYQIKSSKFKIIFTDSNTAELAKYMENSFLALKVTFCSEFAHIADKLGISYPELREIFVNDKRMGNSHTYINPNKPYYDSHCLNKDIPALIYLCKRNNISVPLMESVNTINKNYKKQKQS